MNKMLCLFSLFIFSAGVFAQTEVLKSNEIETFNGKPYYIHTIEQGQTVFSIAKAYDITVQELYEANSFAREGLKTGHLLRIPVNSEKKSDPTVTTQSKTEIADTLFLLNFVAAEDFLISQLAKRFQISISEILRYNPVLETKEIIRKNDILQLPLTSIDIVVDYLLGHPDADVLTLIPHRVSKGETLYSISREYGSSVSTLQKLNPGLEETISTGQIFYVPAGQQTEMSKQTDRSEEIKQSDKTEKQTIPLVKDCIQIKEKKQYRVALLLPLYLEHAESIIINPSAKQNLQRNYRSFDYIQFYEGFMIALNKLNLNNASVSLDVYDVSEGEDKINRLASRGVLDVDLIIGPFMRKPLEKLSQWSLGKNIRIMDLYMPDEVDYSLDNPMLMSAIPSVSEQLKGLLFFIRDFDPDKNVIVVYTDNISENILIEKIKHIQAVEIGYQIRYYSYGSGGISGLVNMLNHDKHNIVINFSNNEVFLNNFTRSLFDNAEKYQLTLFGLPSWLRFESLDLRYFNHFNTHFISSQFVDYSKENVQGFVREFQNTYLTDPNRMAFLGHDVATYMFELLTMYGTDFPLCTHLHTPELLSTGFIFERQGENGQFQNMYVSVFEIIDFQLFDSRRRPVRNE
jgi:LysM repeat protein